MHRKSIPARKSAAPAAPRTAPKRKTAKRGASRKAHPDGPEVDASSGFSVEAEYVPDGSDEDDT